MRRITAIAASAFHVLLLGLGGETELVFAEQRPTYKRMEPIAPPSQAMGKYVALSGDDAAMHSSVVDTLPQPPADHFLEMSPDIEESCTVECESCQCCDDIEPDCCDTVTRGRWIVDLGASALQTQMAANATDEWPNEFGPAGRLTVGYEWPSGLGVRAQGWQYSMEGDVQSQSPITYSYYNPYYDYYDYYFYSVIPGALNRPLYASYAYSRPIEVSAATVYLDVFKTIYSRYGELSIGMGPAFANLEFNFPPAGDGMQYYGGGITVSGQGFLHLVERGRWKVGLTGRTRAALLAGSWELTSPGSASEQSESMSIFELSAGPELRYRVGATSDRYIFLRTVAEFQQWRSDGMGPIAGDTLALQGATMNLGILW